MSNEPSQGAGLQDRDSRVEASVKLALLGLPRLCRPSAPDHVLERRDAALLALLALDGPQARAKLARWLWPDAKPSGALTNLRQRFYRINRAAGLAVVVGADTVCLADSVLHDLNPDALAPTAFDLQLLATHDYDDCEPLGERVDALRARWRRMCIDTVDRQAQQCEDDRDLDRALALAERLLVDQPTSEQAYRRVIRLHYLRGDTAQALTVLEACKTALRHRLGVEPAAETVALARLVRSSASSGSENQGKGAIAVPTGAGLLALARPPRLVGREAEWAELQAAWAQQAVIVLRGVAGIGKSRLAEDFARAQGPVQVFKVHASEQAQPYALVSRLLSDLRPGLGVHDDWVSGEIARIAPAWGKPAPGPLEELRWREAMVAALASWPRTKLGALLIDDLQWADAASLEALLAWLSKAGSARPNVLLTLRSEEVPQAVQSWLQQRQSGEVLDVRLGPLGPGAIVALLESVNLPGLAPEELTAAATRLNQQVGGHPYMLLEVMRASPQAWWLEDSGPQSGLAHKHLLAMIDRRLSHLSPGALRLARLAALSGGDFSVPLAAEVLGQHAVDLVDDWRALTEAQLIQSDGLLFDLVCEAAQRSVPLPIGRVLHEAIASALERRAVRPEVIADHWQRCAQWGKAAAHFEQAAQAAFHVSRRTEEMAFWDQASACHERGGERERAWRAKASAVDAALVVGDANAIEQRSVALLEGATNDLERFDALLKRSRALVNADLGIATPGPSAEAMAIAERLGDETRRVSAAAAHGLALAWSGDPPGGVALLERFAGTAEALADQRVQLSYFSSLGLALADVARYRDAVVASARAADIAHALADRAEELVQVDNLSVALRQAGERDAAVIQGSRALELWRQLGKPSSTSTMGSQVNLAALFADVGRLGEAVDLTERALTHFRRVGPSDWRIMAEQRLQVTYMLLGQHARARQALTPLPPDCDANLRLARIVSECRMDHLAGKPVRAIFEAAMAEYGPKVYPRNRLTLRMQTANVMPADEAVPEFRAVLAEVVAIRDRSTIVEARARLADALRRVGHLDEAAREAAVAWSDAKKHSAFGFGFVGLCWLIFQAADAGGEETTALEALRSGAGWIARALPNVPPPFVYSFKHRNPVNRDLLAMAGRRLHGDSASPTQVAAPVSLPANQLSGAPPTRGAPARTRRRSPPIR